MYSWEFFEERLVCLRIPSWEVTINSSLMIHSYSGTWKRELIKIALVATSKNRYRRSESLKKLRKEEEKRRRRLRRTSGDWLASVNRRKCLTSHVPFCTPRSRLLLLLKSAELSLIKLEYRNRTPRKTHPVRKDINSCPLATRFFGKGDSHRCFFNKASPCNLPLPWQAIKSPLTEFILPLFVFSSHCHNKFIPRLWRSKTSFAPRASSTKRLTIHDELIDLRAADAAIVVRKPIS